MSEGLPIAYPGFEGRGLALLTAGMWKGAGLLLDGAPVPMKGGVFLVKNNAGAEVMIKFVRGFIDPIPKLRIGQDVVTLAKPFTWYQYIFIALPLSLFFLGGLLGALFGAIAAYLNAQIMRTSQPAVLRYGLCLALVVAAAVAYLIVAIPIAMMLKSGG